MCIAIFEIKQLHVDECSLYVGHMMRTRERRKPKAFKLNIRTDSGADGLGSLMDCPLVTPWAAPRYVAEISQFFADQGGGATAKFQGLGRSEAAGA